METKHLRDRSDVAGSVAVVASFAALSLNAGEEGKHTLSVSRANDPSALTPTPTVQ